MRSKTAERNRLIFAAHENGLPLEDMTRQFAVSGARIQQIIRDERHKLANN
jgi:Mor family transcriptional regulator